MIPRVRIKRANVNESGGREPVPIRSHPCSSLVSCQDSWIAYWDQERKTLRKSPLRSPSAHWSTSEWGTDFINRKRPEFRAKNLAYASNYGDYIVKSICFTQSPSHCRLWETILFEHLQVFSNHHIDPYRSISIHIDHTDTVCQEIRMPMVSKKMISPRPQEETDFSPGVNEHGLLLTLLLCSHLMSRMLSKFFLQLNQSKADRCCWVKTPENIWLRDFQETFKRHSSLICQRTFPTEISAPRSSAGDSWNVLPRHRDAVPAPRRCL